MAIVNKMKSPSGSFLGHSLIYLISLRFVAAISFVSETHFYYSVIIYQPHLSDILWYSFLCYFAVSFLISCSQFHLSDSFSFDVRFLVSFLSLRFLLVWCSFLGLLSQSHVSLWIARARTQKQHILSSHRRLFYTMLFNYIPAGLLSSQTLQYRQSGNVRPGLFSDAAIIADGRFYRTHSNTR